MNKNILGFVVLLLAILNSNCSKDFLDVKPDKKLVVPETIADFQGLLDDVNYAQMHKTPLIGQMGDDEWFTTDAHYESMSQFSQFQNAYLWEDLIFENGISSDWSIAYTQVLYSNIVLEGATVIVPKNQQETNELNQVLGGAFFFRAKAFYNLLELFAKPYDAFTENQDLGIPLRVSADIHARVQRSSIRECYTQILNDLEQAVALLPEEVSVVTRPSKAAAHGLLARIFLTLDNYTLSLHHANEALNINNNLLDYNQINESNPFPFNRFNKEVILHNEMSGFSYVHNSPLAFIDTVLYNSYAANDLRKKLFFTPSTVADQINFRGTYSGDYTIFSGIATDELFLIKAECLARLNKTIEAIETLNDLIETRWLQGTFVSYQTTDPEVALQYILDERRKELVFRGHRWHDLRRLNKEPQFAKTLTRTVEGVIYTLPPNDNRYVFPIPQQEVEMLGLIQNPR